MKDRWWLLWLMVGAGSALLYPTLDRAWAIMALSFGIGAGSCVLIVVSVRRHRPANGWAWYVFAAGLAVWVLGDVVIFAEAALGRPTFPSWADACYLGSYPLLVVSLFRLSRQGGPRLTRGLIDAAIIAISVGLVYWTFVIDPIIAAGGPALVRAVTAGYPTAAVFLCAVVVPLLVRRGPRTASVWLLTAGSAIVLACNAVYTLLPAVMASAAPVVYAGYLLAYACWAAAALHPSMAAAAPARDDDLGRSKLILMTGAMLLVPAIPLMKLERDGLPVALGSMVLFVLVVTRLAGYIATARRQSRKLHDLALRDELTGLANRRWLEGELSAALADGGTPQVIMVDVAEFKAVNDRLGRAVGDQTLLAVAQRLTAGLRGTDVVARMGGDEFAVLVRDARPADGPAVTARIHEALRRPVAAGHHELLVAVRLGAAHAEPGDGAAELLRRADTALHAAKATGAAHCVWTAELDADAEAAARLGADLRHGLDAGQFRLVYQPIVELPTGRVVGVEALVRWTHPERGFVSPVDFIPAAENNGLIVELGEWIMRTACTQAVAWRVALGADAPRYVSVNVSARQLSEPGFAEVVADILATTGLPAGDLLVEITETAVFGGGVALRAVEALHRLGIRVALDDFGTGHSSLGLLQTVPVDVLKVDKSFVDEITTAGRQVVIAQALIDVSQGLGLRAVAEGVETADQAAELYQLGYRYAQGYHFGRPVDQPDFRALSGVLLSDGV